MTNYPAKRKKPGVVVHPEMPNTLPESCLTLWNDICDYGAGFYKESDTQAIERYVMTSHLNTMAYDAMMRTGELVEIGSQGQGVVSPQFRIYKETPTQLLALEDRLGLSPRSNAEIGLNKLAGAKAQNELEKYLTTSNKEETND